MVRICVCLVYLLPSSCSSHNPIRIKEKTWSLFFLEFEILACIFMDWNHVGNRNKFSFSFFLFFLSRLAYQLLRSASSQKTSGQTVNYSYLWLTTWQIFFFSFSGVVFPTFLLFFYGSRNWKGDFFFFLQTYSFRVILYVCGKVSNNFFGVCVWRNGQ